MNLIKENLLKVINGGVIDLGNNLILRLGTSKDTEKIVELNEIVQGIGTWARCLADDSHPNINYSNFTVVEDIVNNRLVSSMCYIPQTWTYGQVNLAIARTDMVNTLPEYRFKGLIRRQFELIHELCELKGILVESLVGRSWIYRKFGYDMALRYWKSHVISKDCRNLFKSTLHELFSIRPVIKEDIAFCTQLFKKMRDKHSVTCVWEEKNWLYDIFHRNESDLLKLSVIEDKNNSKVGALLHSTALEESTLSVYLCELEETVSWLSATPPIIEYLSTFGESLAQKESSTFNGVDFSMRDNHPVYNILTNVMSYNRQYEGPLAWYIRVNDISKFITHISPELEKRIANSYAIGYTGNLEISFYEPGSGLVIEFENGKIIASENRDIQQSETAFPIEYFKQLIFGYRSLTELERNSAEVSVSYQSRIILNIIFPKCESYIFSIS